jgi:WD40 repeat protein
MDVAFTPDGKWLLSVSSEGEDRSEGQLRAWPLQGQNGGVYRVLLEQPMLGFWIAMLAIDPSGEHVAVGSQFGRVYVVPVAGGSPRELSPASESVNYRVAFSQDGRLLATVPRHEGVVEVWDLETGESREIGSVRGSASSVRFVDERRLLWSATIRGSDDRDDRIEEETFDLVTGASEVISSEDGREFSRTMSRDGSIMLTVQYTGPRDSPDTDLFRTDLGTGRTDRISSHGDDPFKVAFDPSGRWIVTAGVSDGLVRVGPISSEVPHLLYGHQGTVHAVAVSPDGRWIASAGDDKTVRLWPMPDMSEPPLHTLPHDELIARLETLTNLRAVRDEDSPTGWKVEVGPFPGWAEVPEW